MFCVAAGLFIHKLLTSGWHYVACAEPQPNGIAEPGGRRNTHPTGYSATGHERTGRAPRHRPPGI
jgi:hypothetical protein